MLQTCLGWIACLFGRHQWEQGPNYRYILNDSGIRFYQCARCGRSKSTR